MEFLRRRDAGHTTGDYVIALDAGWTIDADNAETSSWLRYINHSSRRANVASFHARPRRGLEASRGAIFFEIKKLVAVGEELLVDYKEDYWLFRYPAGPLDSRWWAVKLG
jgi:SET domain-containing protein